MRLPLAAAILLAFLAVAPPPADRIPLDRMPARPGATPTPSALYDATHVRLVYGTIESIRDRAHVILRLRNGSPQHVDASDVLRTGHYSAPLFVGKVVEVTGHLQPDGSILATTMYRATSLKGMQPDTWLLPPR